MVSDSVHAEIVVVAGDFGIRGERNIELFDNLKDLSAPLFIVSGNHDRPAELASYCATQPDVHFLNGHAHGIHGITLFGFGGEIPSHSDVEWNETMTEADADKCLRQAPAYDVLLTRTPPNGYCDRQKNRAHEGSEAIASAIRRDAPSLCLCGHIHHSWGSIEQLDKTTVHNVGPRPHWRTLSPR